MVRMPLGEAPVKHFLLLYDFVDDYLERRGALRPAHFELAKAAVALGSVPAAWTREELARPGVGHRGGSVRGGAGLTFALGALS